MKWVVLANALQKEELLSRGVASYIRMEWISKADELISHPDADACIDLLFENTKARISLLEQLLPRLVIINAVTTPLEKINSSFIRINAWNTFLKREMTEAAGTNEHSRTEAEKVLKALSRKTEWVQDVPGFIAGRVVAMIVNEAYFALEEGVSSKGEIDIAMKTGTNYPYGPFEWGEKIGLKNICELLVTLSKTNKRYTPASMLQKEVF